MLIHAAEIKKKLKSIAPRIALNFLKSLFFFFDFFSACKRNFVKSLQTKLPEIPPFRGYVMYKKIVGTIEKSATG